jgi:putative RNA 2'-phosphotransferase
MEKRCVTAQYNPRTLSKTLSYLAYHAPAEHGLFWDPDGTMPWKELYWALQEDPSLRFVRESHIRELNLLGLDLPFVLDGNLLRLRSDLYKPSYPLVQELPERLYFACRRKQYAVVMEHGIDRGNRSFVPLSADRDLALRIGKRRDQEVLLLQVLAAKACNEGEAIRLAGAGLYLVERVPLRYLIFPLIRAEQFSLLTSRKKPETKPARRDLPLSPGSFLLDARQLEGHSSGVTGGDKSSGKRGPKKSDWKRDAKKERHKRNP